MTGNEGNPQSSGEPNDDFDLGDALLSAALSLPGNLNISRQLLQDLSDTMSANSRTRGAGPQPIDDTTAVLLRIEDAIADLRGTLGGFVGATVNAVIALELLARGQAEGGE